MGHKHAREEVLAAAVAVAFEDGLSQLTFGRVARRLGISDRIVVYYFPSKDDLVGSVLSSLAEDLVAALEPAFTAPADDHVALVRAAWPVLSRPDVDRVFACYFEAAGLASIGREPYRTLVPVLVENWTSWAAQLIDGTPARRRAEAEATIAVLDGLLLLRQLAGPKVADRAARRLGARP